MGGVEPPIVSLTGSRLTTRPHRIVSVRTVGLEPTISCSRGTRNTRLSYVLIGRPCKLHKLRKHKLSFQKSHPAMGHQRRIWQR